MLAVSTMATSTSDEEFNRAREALSKGLGDYFEQDEGRHKIPRGLFHLTTPECVHKILSAWPGDPKGTHGILWASETSTMNDVFEVTYGRGLAMRQLKSRRSPFAEKLHDIMETNRPPVFDPEARLVLRSFVVSFCSGTDDRKSQERARGIDTASAWLNYGRSGTGAAICFKAEALQHLPNATALVEVDYAEKSQQKRIADFLEIGPRVLGELGVLGEEWALELAAHVTHVWISRLAVQMKHPSFEAEDEWRLVYTTMTNQAFETVEEITFPARLRFGQRGRTVPYVEIPFPLDAAMGIVLGYASPAREEHIKEQLTEPMRRRVQILRSGVPVRPS